MNINDIDRLGKFDVDGTGVKTFYKKLSRGDLLGVEAGCTKNYGNSEHVYLAFDVRDENLIREYRVQNQREEPFRVAFSCSSKNELAKFIEALEFALGVLKQGRDLEQAF